MTDKELENLFKEKLGQREVPFNPENWAAMEQILDSKNSNGLAFFWRWAAVIVGFGVIAALLTIGKPASPENNMAGEEVIENISESHRDEPRKVNPEELMNSSSSQSAPDHAQEINTSTGQTPESATTAPEQGLSSSRANDETHSENANTETFNKSIAANSQSTKPAKADGRGNFNEDMLLPADSEESALQNEMALALKEPSVPFNANLDLYEISLADLEQESMIKPRFGGNQNLYAQAGLVVSTAFNDRSAGLGYEAGLHFSHRLNRKLSIDAGAAYVRQRNVGIVAISDSTFYDFGKETIHTERTTTELDILEVPIRVSFEPIPDHQLSFAFYGSYLLASHEELYREHHRMKMAPIIHETEEMGDLSAYNRFNYGVGAGYHYTFNQLSIGADVRWGLSDLTLGGNAAFDKTHQNFSTRLQLRYSLWSN